MAKTADAASARTRLTDAVVRKLAVPERGNRIAYCADTPGFGARVTAAGARSFVFNYRVRGVERRKTIGRFPDWSSTAARKEAGRLRVLVDQGVDPLEAEAKADAEGMRLANFWAHVYEPLHVTTRRPSWAKDVRSLAQREILPRLGRRPVRDVDEGDAAALHRAITKRGATYLANRALAVLSHLLSFAERRHETDAGEKVPALRPKGSNPCKGLVRNPEVKRERYLRPDEIVRLTDALARHPGVAADLVRWLMLTGCRFSEAANARWRQFDLEAGTWTRASHETKQNKQITTPLSAPALALLAELRERNGGCPHVFPSPRGRPVKSVKTAWSAICRDAGLKDLRVHDLRHSFAAALVSSGASLVLIGKLLGHSQVQTTARYAHADLDPLREAAERVGAIVSGRPPAEVVPLKRERR